MQRLLSVLVVAGALVAPVTTSSASTDRAHPGLGIRLLETPTALAKDPRAHTYIIDHLAPGTVIQRKIQVVDGTTNPLRVALYAAGARITKGLWSPFPGTTPDELSSWVNVQPGGVALAPNQSTTAEVRIAVPKDASSGERYAV